MDPMARWGIRLFAPNPRTWTLAEERDLFKRVKGSRGHKGIPWVAVGNGKLLELNKSVNDM